MSVEQLNQIWVHKNSAHGEESFTISIAGQKRIYLTRKEAEDLISELRLIDNVIVDWYARKKFDLAVEDMLPNQTLVTCPDINLGRRRLDFLHRELSFRVLDLTPREWFRSRIEISKKQPEREALYSQILEHDA